MQVEGSNRQQVNDGKRAEDIAGACVALSGKVRVFGRHIKAQHVFKGKYGDRENIEIVEPVLVGLENRWHLLEQQCKQIDHNQYADPLVKELLVITLDIGVQ